MEFHYNVVWSICKTLSIYYFFILFFTKLQNVGVSHCCLIEKPDHESHLLYSCTVSKQLIKSIKVFFGIQITLRCFSCIPLLSVEIERNTIYRRLCGAAWSRRMLSHTSSFDTLQPHVIYTALLDLSHSSSPEDLNQYIYFINTNTWMVFPEIWPYMILSLGMMLYQQIICQMCVSFLYRWEYYLIRYTVHEGKYMEKWEAQIWTSTLQTHSSGTSVAAH